MPTKHITFVGKQTAIACDGRCDKAWGIVKRPRTMLSDDVDDYVYKGDAELGTAPALSGETEGGYDKPSAVALPDTAAAAEQMNKWCARQCERCAMPSALAAPGQPIPLPDMANPRPNITRHAGVRDPYAHPPPLPTLASRAEEIMHGVHSGFGVALGRQTPQLIADRFGTLTPSARLTETIAALERRRAEADARVSATEAVRDTKGRFVKQPAIEPSKLARVTKVLSMARDEYEELLGPGHPWTELLSGLLVEVAKGHEPRKRKSRKKSRGSSTWSLGSERRRGW